MSEKFKDILSEDELEALFEEESNIEGTVIGLLRDADLMIDILESNIEAGKAEKSEPKTDTEDEDEDNEKQLSEEDDIFKKLDQKLLEFEKRKDDGGK